MLIERDTYYVDRALKKRLAGGYVLNYRYDLLAPPLVVGRAARARGRGYGYFAAVDSVPLQHHGRIPLLATWFVAQPAAVLAAVYYAWHKVLSLALQAGMQSLELMKLSDEPVNGVSAASPRYQAVRRALCIDDWIAPDATGEPSPLRDLARATGVLYGATVVAEDERLILAGDKALTFATSDCPDIDIPGTVSIVKQALRRLDHHHDPDRQRWLDNRWVEILADVDRQSRRSTRAPRPKLTEALNEMRYGRPTQPMLARADEPPA